MFRVIMVMFVVLFLQTSNSFATDKTFIFNDVGYTQMMAVPHYSSMSSLTHPSNANATLEIGGHDQNGVSQELWISATNSFTLSDQTLLKSCEQKALLVQSDSTKYKMQVLLLNFTFSMPVGSLMSVKVGDGDIICGLISK